MYNNKIKSFVLVLLSALFFSACAEPNNIENITLIDDKDIISNDEEEIVDNYDGTILEEDTTEIPNDSNLVKKDGVFSIVKMTMYDGKDNCLGYIYSSYDVNDALLREYCVNADGIFLRSYDYEVDSYGNRTKYTLTEADEIFPTTNYVNEYDDNNNIIKHTTLKDEGYDYIEYFYDDKNQLVKRLEHILNIINEKEYPYEYRYEYEYDSKGNIVNEFFYDDLENKRVYLYQYEYDSNDYLVKKIYYSGEEISSIYIYKNDINGNKIKIEEYNDNNELKKESNYVYDNNGNIIKFNQKDKDGNIIDLRIYEYY